jgi:hypothetical protein
MRSFIASLLFASSVIALPSPAAPKPKPPPKPETCVSKSQKAGDWIVEDFDYHANYLFSTPAHQISTGYVNFTLSNPVLDYKSSCTATSTWLSEFFYGNIVYSCDVPIEGDKATFTYDHPAKNLRINQTWACAEEGGRFDAEGGVKLKLDCKETYWQNPNWQPGQFYSTRLLECGHVTVNAPIETIRGVL